MASVTSLDKDLRNLRLGKYTPQVANEIREWIDEILGERLPSGDLLDVLKDGTALCKYSLTTSSYRTDSNQETQISKSCNRIPWSTVQSIVNALCSNGEHIPFPSSMPKFAT